MMKDILEQYTALRTQLQKERAELQARLAGIAAALDGQIPVPKPAAEANAPATRKRRMSAAGRAAIRAAAKARWAAFRAKKTGKATPKPGSKPKRKTSAAARAKMAAAAKARWAKAKAAGKTKL